MGLRAVKIDTLSLAKELENTGIPRPQAEAQVQTTIKVINMVIEEKLASKHDLLLTEEKLSDTIKHVEEKLSARINAVEDKLSHRINAVEDKLSHRINAVEDKLSELKHILEQLPNSLTIKISSILGSIVGIGVAILAILIKLH
jgi:chromosome segregation ATPase